MTFRSAHSSVFTSFAVLSLLAGLGANSAAQSSSSSGQSSSPGSSSRQGSQSGQVYAQEKTPALIDPAGPTISLISSEPVFVMSAALNACGYDEGLE